MGVGAGVGRALRVCDIVGSVTLGCAGVGGSRISELWDRVCGDPRAG